MSGAYPISAELRKAGVIFREDFTNQTLTAKNGGVPTGAPDLAPANKQQPAQGWNHLMTP
jgi:hypothetical protein